MDSIDQVLSETIESLVKRKHQNQYEQSLYHLRVNGQPAAVDVVDLNTASEGIVDTLTKQTHDRHCLSKEHSCSLLNLSHVAAQALDEHLDNKAFTMESSIYRRANAYQRYGRSYSPAGLMFHRDSTTETDYEPLNDAINQIIKVIGNNDLIRRMTGFATTKVYSWVISMSRIVNDAELEEVLDIFNIDPKDVQQLYEMCNVKCLSDPYYCFFSNWYVVCDLSIHINVL